MRLEKNLKKFRLDLELNPDLCDDWTQPPVGGGGYFRNFWVEMCRWDPGILSLYQS